MTPFSISSITNNPFSKKEIDMKAISLIHDVYTPNNVDGKASENC